MAVESPVATIHTVGRIVFWVVVALMALAVVYSGAMVALNWNAIGV